MKKILFILLVCLCSASAFAASGNEYIIDDQKVEQVFTGSTDVSLTVLSPNSLVSVAGLNFTDAARFRASDKNFLAAILLNFFLGEFGIHRLYLGTATMTWIGYILSCGGIFGVVPFVDFIVLIVHNDDISEYVDNPKFFMWS